jgi:mannose-6-phosphate isomerase-like protein (cupin superfamily)
MCIFIENLETLTLGNEYYRKVINTNTKQQLVLMCLNPGEDIPNEIHDNVSQFIKIEQGNGEIIINNTETHKFSSGFGIIIPPNTYHWIKNTSSEKLKLYSIYSPKEHPIDRLDERQPSDENIVDEQQFYKKYKIINILRKLNFYR